MKTGAQPHNPSCHALRQSTIIQKPIKATIHAHSWYIPAHSWPHLSSPSGHLFIICLTSVDKLQSSEFIRILIGLSVSVPMMNDYSVRPADLNGLCFKQQLPAIIQQLPSNVLDLKSATTLKKWYRTERKIGYAEKEAQRGENRHKEA